MPSDRRLARWYREYNRRWFAGRLPRVDLRFAALSDAYGELADTGGRRLLLTIDADRCFGCPRAVRLTLLHEMVHVDLWPHISHGPVFQREMQRLAAAGAFRGLW